MISVTDRRMFGNDSIETQERMAELLKRRRAWCHLGQGRRFGDLNVLLRALIAANLDHTTQRELEELGLHYKQAMEIRKMRRQLITLINSSAAVKEKLDVSSEMKPPSDDQVRLLRQIFVACLQDRIAKRVDSTATENVPKGAYQTQKLEEYVFIDSTSVLYKDEPEWVLYQEIVEVHNKKKCMQQVMVVESEWLPKLAESSCTFTEVKDKSPTFDEASGEVVRPMQVTFSNARQWPVGEYQRTVPETIERYRFFGQFLLEGRVFPKLAEFSQCMLYPAATLIKQYAKQQRHCEALLNALVEKEVNNREKLKTVWKNTPEFLLEQYCQWIPEYLRDRVRLQWPPL
ncbi:ATP-dependent RNA helicase C06E1.10 in chromosome III [Aphelenchoides avenae]|nr:ATP-dependent RNA helicase C06E1.10 in chromosome III [Aphelenchus avenae]